MGASTNRTIDRVVDSSKMKMIQGHLSMLFLVGYRRTTNSSTADPSRGHFFFYSFEAFLSWLWTIFDRRLLFFFF